MGEKGYTSIERRLETVNMIRNLLASAAAAGLAFAPIAAQAGTRAGDAGTAVSPAAYSDAAARQGAGMSAENEDLVGIPILAIIAGVAAAAAAIYVIAEEIDDDDEPDGDASPGTGG